MALGSFTHDSLADLDVADLDRMLELDETLFVEHKSGLGAAGDTHGLMTAVASFANTLGGWLLIGVKNGKPVGGDDPWAQPEAPTLVDAVRDRLLGQLDPLPAFEARVLPHAAGSVGVVRVYESSDTPHVSVGSGSVYVREVAGVADASAPRRPGAGLQGERAYRATQIRSRTQLLELADRGRVAAARVEGLLDPTRPLPLIVGRLPLKLEPIGNGGFQPVHSERAAIVVRLVPFTLAPRFLGWATTSFAAAAVLGASETLSMKRGLDNSWVVPDPSGAAVTVPLDVGSMHKDAGDCGLGAMAHVVLDGAGIAGAALELASPTEELRRPWIRLSSLAREFIRPVIAAAAGVLTEGEFLGRARCQIDLIGLPRTFLLEEGGQDGTGRPWVPTAGDLVLPADDGQIESLALRSANAYGRSAGVPAWD